MDSFVLYGRATYSTVRGAPRERSPHHLSHFPYVGLETTFAPLLVGQPNDSCATAGGNALRPDRPPIQRPPLAGEGSGSNARAAHSVEHGGRKTKPTTVSQPIVPWHAWASSTTSQSRVARYLPQHRIVVEPGDGGRGPPVFRTPEGLPDLRLVLQSEQIPSACLLLLSWLSIDTPRRYCTTLYLLYMHTPSHTRCWWLPAFMIHIVQYTSAR